MITCYVSSDLIFLILDQLNLQFTLRHYSLLHETDIKLNLTAIM